MAETIMRDLLRKKFPHMFQPGLPDPVLTGSAGLSALPGAQASPEAVAVMQKRGLCLKGHQSRPLTERLLRNADLVLTMTAAHRHAILQRWPEFANKIHLMSDQGDDVSDPFGGSSSVYAACADQLNRFLSLWVDRIDESWFPKWTGELS